MALWYPQIWYKSVFPTQRNTYAGTQIYTNLPPKLTQPWIVGFWSDCMLVHTRLRSSWNPRTLKSKLADAHCSMSIKFTTDYHHVTPDLPQTFKVNGSKVKVIAWHNVLASKIITFLERIAWLSQTLCKLFQSIAQHVIHVQDHKVKHSNRNNSAADCSIPLKFGTVFDHGTNSIV